MLGGGSSSDFELHDEAAVGIGAGRGGAHARLERTAQVFGRSVRQRNRDSTKAAGASLGVLLGAKVVQVASLCEHEIPCFESSNPVAALFECTI
eukprot:CAMPEP_0113666352 /NCGR_PEP_ID=MMETSP0038_2-20120614/2826_1 /TAXON_ID=2898 /ORGANISM="Cryptomonas paramecium" /LENGTH=93 /DNA_ID=CAMNT_0000581833 /DNA_START=89 /DNA_END=370 /DNA_ORIENTATION=- /assembly_acc=CAM_ASM_000170